MTPGIACEDIAAHPDFVSLHTLQGIEVDLRYATRDNFVGKSVYGGLDCAFLRREAAAGLLQARDWLQAARPGWCLRVLDALRPQRVQEALYAELAGTPLARYLAAPERGSIHSFGMAVDLTLVDAAGHELDMGAAFERAPYEIATESLQALGFKVRGRPTCGRATAISPAPTRSARPT
jgi:D-alanyl-D-alanine dipeptidase